MKALIKTTVFKKEYESRHGTLYLHEVKYNDKKAFYSSKAKDQKKFVAGQEAEFTEEDRTGKHGAYLVIKPLQNTNYSNFNRAVKKEQSRYSGFAMSYAKDLVCEGKIQKDSMYTEAKKMLDWMVEQDKNLSV